MKAVGIAGGVSQNASTVEKQLVLDSFRDGIQDANERLSSINRRLELLRDRLWPEPGAEKTSEAPEVSGIVAGVDESIRTYHELLTKTEALVARLADL